MSSPFKNVEIKYLPLEKKYFVLVWVVKKLWHYILRSQVIAIVPDAAVKSLLMQSEFGERRGKWMAILQEFDLEIHPMKLVIGTSLSKSMVNASDNIICQQYKTQSFSNDPWYVDIVYFMLNNQCPEGMNATQRSMLRMKSSHYMLKGGLLYKKNFEGVYLRCLD